MSNTISFSEKVKGWTSFHSFIPEFMIGMNNSFFSFKNGDLYVHHSDNVGRNNFYGVDYSSKVSLMFNNNASDIKEVQAVSLEGSLPWNTDISAFVSDSTNPIKSTIKQNEYVNKEGFWYSYVRRNEQGIQFDSKSSYGIGEVDYISEVDDKFLIVIDSVVHNISEGDVIIKPDTMDIVNSVISVEYENNTTKICVSEANSIGGGDFIIGTKNPRIEGGNLRGYTLRVDLETSTKNKAELFAVNAEVIKSFS